MGFSFFKYPVPKNNRRACLCRDGSYKNECCDPNDYFAQGIGKDRQSDFFLLTEGGDIIVQEDSSKIFI